MSEIRLSEEQLQRIVQQAAALAVELVWKDLYFEIGKTSFRLVLYVAGALVLVALGWLGVHQKIGM